jgi:hypothetical protein
MPKKTDNNQLYNSKLFQDKLFRGGLVASVIMISGVFLPFVKIDRAGELNYFSNGQGDGGIVIALALISLGFIVFRLWLGVILAGYGSILLYAYSYAKLFERVTILRSNYPVSELTPAVEQAILQTVQMQHGLSVMVVGSLILIRVGCGGISNGNTSKMLQILGATLVFLGIGVFWLLETFK